MDIDLTATSAKEQRGRAVFWHYTSQVFIDIPDHVIVERTRTLLPLVSELSENGKADMAAKKLTAFLSECDGLTDDETDERLNMAYTAVFYLNTPVFTSESAWLSPDRLVMQEQWEQVLCIYEMYGFKKPEAYPEPEDHIGLEFLFMASLSNSVAELLTQKPQDYMKQAERLMVCKKRFLESHLGKWIGMFVTGVLKKSETMSLYAGAALLGAAMVELEENSINKKI